MLRKYQTTDGRYFKVGEDEWWDTTGVEIVPESVIDEYMALKQVGIAVSDCPEEHEIH